MAYAQHANLTSEKDENLLTDDTKTVFSACVNHLLTLTALPMGLRSIETFILSERTKHRKINRIIFVAFLENIWYIRYDEDDAAMLIPDPADGME